MRITVIGTGYVGLVTGSCLAYIGHHVTCVDADGAKIDALNSGQAPFYEPHLMELIARAKENGAIDFRTDMETPVAESEAIFIAVGTPSLPNGASDLSYLETAAHSIGAAMDASQPRVVINKSTVPVGSGNLVEALVREGIAEAGRNRSGSIRFGIASNPEFLREGSAIRDTLYPDRIVVGANDEHTLSVLRELYRPLVKQTFAPPSFLPRPDHLEPVSLVATTLTSAEMIKYAANAFLAMKVSFANEMANICERVGAEITEVVRGIGLDRRIGSRFLAAGIGWGGSCFGKDLQSLTQTAAEYGYHPRLLVAAQEVNRAQRQLVLQKLQEKLFVLKGRTIGLLGLAFKPNTDDLRDAPSLDIAVRLLKMGARVKVYDPIAMDACRRQRPELKIQYCGTAGQVAEGADAIVLVTEWDEFAALNLAKLASRMAHPILIDGRNVIDSVEALNAGFDYSGIGRCSRPRPLLQATA